MYLILVLIPLQTFLIKTKTVNEVLKFKCYSYTQSRQSHASRCSCGTFGSACPQLNRTLCPCEGMWTPVPLGAVQNVDWMLHDRTFIFIFPKRSSYFL